MIGSKFDASAVLLSLAMARLDAREGHTDGVPCLFSAGDGTLFEYDEAERQWRERGRGEMKVCMQPIS